MKKNDFSCECIVIGGGIIGLAVAAALSQKGIEVIVLEAEDLTIQHASSHNSEVIHSGIYYQANSLKAKLCIEGNHLLYSHCKKLGIDYKKVGKFIAVDHFKEIHTLEKLLLNAENNGVEEIFIIEEKDLLKIEPFLIAKLGLFSGTTGIIDSHAFAISLEAAIEQLGSHIITGSPVINGVQSGKRWNLEIGGLSPCIVHCDLVINAAGFNAIKLAQKFGIKDLPDPIFVKGHYYKYHAKNPFKHLIYPLPHKHGLGIHTSTDMANTLRFGPDAEIIKKPNYMFSSNKKRAEKFSESISIYFRGFNQDLLEQDFCGVRVRLKEDHNSSDFSILFPEHHGLDGLVNLAGIESPGLTASLALANYVADRL